MASNKTVSTTIRIVDEASKTLDGIKEEVDRTGKATDDMRTKLASVDDSMQQAQEASAGFRQQIMGLREAMAQMLADGVDPADEKFQNLAHRAGALQDAIGDANAIIRDFASDTHHLDQYIDGMKGLAGAYGIYKSAISLAGVQDEKMEQTMQKLLAVTTMLNSVQELQNQLRNQSSGIYKAYHAILRLVGIEKAKVTTATKTNTGAIVANTTATKATTFATKAATAAVKGFKAALASTGIGLLVVGVGELATKLFDLIGSLTGTEEAEENLGKTAQNTTISLEAQKNGVEALTKAVSNLKQQAQLDAEYEAVVHKNKTASFAVQKKALEDLRKEYEKTIESANADIELDDAFKGNRSNFSGTEFGSRKDAEDAKAKAIRGLQEVEIEEAKLADSIAAHKAQLAQEEAERRKKAAEAASMKATYEEDKKSLDNYIDSWVSARDIEEEHKEALKKSTEEIGKILDKNVETVADRHKKAVAEAEIAVQELQAKYKEGAASIYSSSRSISSAITGVISSLQEEGNAWGKVSAVIDGTMQMYSAVGAIIETVQGIQETASQVKRAVAAANVATNSTEATSNMTVAASGAMAANAAIPWVGVALGIASVAAMIATMASLPKYANGGIAYGPTVGIFGEYAGAKSNPEVVAPLDRLKSLIQPEGIGGGEVRFKIEGRELVGILKKESLKTSRS